MNTDPMDPALAARLTLQRVNPELQENAHPHPAGDGSRHMVYMLQEVAKGDMSAGKANRWLGWAQCLAMIYGHLMLEQCKEINRRAS